MGDNDSFIHSSLDDAGLSAAEFRVFCRIKRRGECTESVPNMATGCRLHPDTVWESISRLIELRMIVRTPRTGKTSIYQVLSPDQWQTPTGNGGVSETKGRPSKPGDPHRKRRGNHPPETEGHKVTPIEVTPFKAIPIIKPVAPNPKTVTLTMQGRRTQELMVRCKQVFGDAEMQHNHSAWYERARDNWDKLDAVLRDVSDKMKREQLKNPAAFAETLWAAWPSRN